MTTDKNYARTIEEAIALLNNGDRISGRQQVLLEAALCVMKDRNQAYGSPESNFGNIANLWNSYLSAKTGVNLLGNPFISPLDVALMMDLVKTARLSTNPTHKDSWIDKAGYAACGGDIVFPAVSAQPSEKDPF